MHQEATIAEWVDALDEKKRQVTEAEGKRRQAEEKE